MLDIDKYSKKQMMIATAVLTAVVSSIITVCLTKALDSVFPSSFILNEKSNSTNGVLMYSMEYSSRSDGKQFLGIVTQYPIWYYSMSIGNRSVNKTGTISVTIDFPKKMKAIWGLLGEREVKVKNTNTIHFQAPQLKPGYGKTFSVAIASLDLPDINRMKMTITSSAGNFEKVPSQHYRSIFKPIEK